MYADVYRHRWEQVYLIVSQNEANEISLIFGFQKLKRKCAWGRNKTKQKRWGYKGRTTWENHWHRRLDDVSLFWRLWKSPGHITWSQGPYVATGLPGWTWHKWTRFKVPHHHLSHQCQKGELSRHCRSKAWDHHLCPQAGEEKEWTSLSSSVWLQSNWSLGKDEHHSLCLESCFSSATSRRHLLDYEALGRH